MSCASYHLIAVAARVTAQLRALRPSPELRPVHLTAQPVSLSDGSASCARKATHFSVLPIGGQTWLGFHAEIRQGLSKNLAGNRGGHLRTIVP